MAISELGKYIDDMHALRAEKRFHEGEVKRINAELALLETPLLKEMEEQGATLIAGKLAEAERKTVLYPQVQDWSLLHSYIASQNMFDLLHKRISLTNYRQLCEAEMDPAGTLRNYVSEISIRSL